jgi:TPR repeat protein
VPASPAPDQAASAGQPVRTLDPESIKLLMQQGEQFVASGDLVTARLVYRRAAESGNAAAALALGATFDPIVLAKIGVRGVGADVEKARSWYEKAKEFGSPDAPRRLEMLANR